LCEDKSLPPVKRGLKEREAESVDTRIALRTNIKETAIVKKEAILRDSESQITFRRRV
jgi:hypothetical protein